MELLQKHFEIALEIPDGIKKLRELILTLAMQGKLVPQNPKDQPASELLKEIEAEKKKLSNEGQIKKVTELKPINKDELPFDIQNGWKWCRLREICYDWGQKTPDKPFVYIDVGSVDNSKGCIIEDVQILDCHSAPSRARKIVKTGTVVYSTVRPYLLNIAILEREYQCETIASTAFAILHPFKGIYNKFIYYFLHSKFFTKYVQSKAKGVAYPAINDGDFFHGLIPLPPFAEQRRIVAKIDQLMALCDKLESERNEQDQKRLTIHTAATKQLFSSKDQKQFTTSWRFITRHFDELYSVPENVADLKKTILQLAVMGKLVPQDPKDQPASELLKEIEAEKKRLVKEGKIKKIEELPAIKPEEIPYEVPRGWEWVRLGNAGLFERGKSKHRPRDDKKLFVGGIYPLVQTGDVAQAKNKNYFIETCNKYYNGFGLAQSKLWEKGTLCITIAANIAETGFLKMDACFPDSVVGYTSLMGTEMDYYVKYFIDFAKTKLEKYAPSTAQKNINLGIINELVFPLPPITVQKRIVAKVDQLMQLCDSLDQHIKDSTEKKSAVLNAVLAEV